jgi:hypothetical protein
MAMSDSVTPLLDLLTITGHPTGRADGRPVAAAPAHASR